MAWHFNGDLLAAGVLVAGSAVVWLALAGLGLMAPIMTSRPRIPISADHTGWRRGQRRFAGGREYC